MDREDAKDMLAVLIMIAFVFVPLLFLVWYTAWNYTSAFFILMVLMVVPTSIMWSYHRLVP